MWLAEELGVDLELVERGTPTFPAYDNHYLQLNPFGLVPFLEDENFSIAESNTILRYLVRREGRIDLLSEVPEDAAKVETWLDWQATDLNDSWRYSFMAKFRDKLGFDDPLLIKKSRNLFDAKIGIIDAKLALTKSFIVGKEFTLADIVIGLSIRRWLAFNPERNKFPNVLKYYSLLCERSSFIPFGGPGSPV